MYSFFCVICCKDDLYSLSEKHIVLTDMIFNNIFISGGKMNKQILFLTLGLLAIVGCNSDSSAVQQQLTNVTAIYATNGAFAALTDG